VARHEGGVTSEPKSPVSDSAPTVPNYLVWAILATVLCCLPIGVPAIIFSAQVNGKLASGDHQGAQKASRTAMILCIVAAAVGFIGWLVAILVFGVAGLGMTAGGYAY
jgi:hypothetical protein